jgi:hypothetical protein
MALVVGATNTVDPWLSPWEIKGVERYSSKNEKCNYRRAAKQREGKKRLSALID